MEYVLLQSFKDCKVLNILVQAQSSGGNSEITLHAKLKQRYFNLCKKLICIKWIYNET